MPIWQRLAARWYARRERAARRLDRDQAWTMRTGERCRVDGTLWL